MSYIGDGNACKEQHNGSRVLPHLQLPSQSSCHICRAAASEQPWAGCRLPVLGASPACAQAVATRLDPGWPVCPAPLRTRAPQPHAHCAPPQRHLQSQKDPSSIGGCRLKSFHMACTPHASSQVPAALEEPHCGRFPWRANAVGGCKPSCQHQTATGPSAWNNQHCLLPIQPGQVQEPLS